MAFLAPLALLGSAGAAAGGFSALGMALSIGSGVVGAVGQIESSQAQAAAASYNAQVQERNATQATNNANMAAQAGEQQTAMQALKTKATVGAITANQAAAGLDVNSGSPLDVRSSASELGELDALTVRSNAAKEAYGYQVQSSNFSAEAALDKSEASADKTAGIVGAFGTLLGTGGSALSNWAKWQTQGGGGTIGSVGDAEESLMTPDVSF